MLSAKQPPGGPRRAQGGRFQPGGGGVPGAGEGETSPQKPPRSMEAGLPRREDLQSPGGCIKIDSTGRLEALREPRPAEFPARFVMSINTSRTDWRGAGQYLYKVRKLWPSPGGLEYRCISSTVGSRWPEKREWSRRPPWRSRSLVSACFL